ncbi:hypothetical protein GCM10010193_37310 [Kitasatospora atroaurantiaca]|uniref:Uncharacterized protein n=1 Tax=Kitasatospora atroaurantiaca TaxID=285545 RepID=A0A561F228_9ACTN|nr:hypothetical protein [Kitasatospora atroaurantiaca]TWE21882.1 hypothetical protein FB465_7124 [Kitasatospora atroaurantiaca]
MKRGQVIDGEDPAAGHCCRMVGRVGALFELEEERLTGGDLPGEIVWHIADPGVVQAGGRGGGMVGDERAGKVTVDEDGAQMGALDAALVLLVVQGDC